MSVRSSQSGGILFLPVTHKTTTSGTHRADFGVQTIAGFRGVDNFLDRIRISRKYFMQTVIKGALSIEFCTVFHETH